MQRSPGKWLLTLWIALVGGLLLACEPALPTQRSETTPGIPDPSRTLPPPAQTRTALSAATLTPAPSPTPTQAASLLLVQPDMLRGLTVTFWHTATGKAETLLQDFTAEFNQTNPWGVLVQPVSHAGLGVLEEEVRLARSEERLPGLIAATTDQALRWDGESFLLADLTPYLTDPVWGLAQSEQQDFYPGFWAQDLAWRNNGSGRQISKRLGVPWYRSALVVFYNRSWAEELGFRTFPDTPDQFRWQVCAAAQANLADQEAENDGTGGWLVTRDPLLLMGWMHAFGGDVELEDRSGYAFGTAASEQAVQSLADLITDGCAWASQEALPAEAFADRRALVWMGSLANLTVQQLALQQAASEDQWVVLPFPSAEGGQTIETYGPALVLVKAQPAQELAGWLFARWLLAPEKQAAWAEANGVFPVRAAALMQARSPGGQLPQWDQALVWLPKARSEPARASWGIMRGVLTDALDQVLSSGFQPEQAEALLAKLDQVAAEIEANLR